MQICKLLAKGIIDVQMFCKMPYGCANVQIIWLTHY